MLIEIILLAALCLLPVMGIVSAFLKSKVFSILLSVFLLLTIAYAAAALFASSASLTLLGILHFYPFSELFIALFSVLMLLVEVLSYNTKGFPSLQMLMSFAFISLVAVPSASNIIIIFMGVELFASLTVLMVLLSGKQHIEASMKFFVLSAASIAMFSVALVLLMPYSSDFSIVPQTLAGGALLVIALVFFIAAMSFDTAMFPFNFWVPDVYEGASANIAAMIAGIGKKLAFVVLIEVLFIFFASLQSTFSPILAALSILTMFYGNFAAMVQKKMRRLFAYSSISQAGYIMIGVAVATQYGIEASIVQIVAHAFMIIAAFAIIMWLEQMNLRTIEDYMGLNSRNKFASIALTLLMLSMAGIPPLLGFDGKLLLFSSAISANMLWLALIGIINSFLSIYYYGKVISAMFTQRRYVHVRMSKRVAFVVIVALAVVVLIGIYPQPVISAAKTASASLFSIASSA
ncbi:MAG: NADH-quinone oxidoreductase subunit N [Candidatus Micrarchaeia archaeon]